MFSRLLLSGFISLICAFSIGLPRARAVDTVSEGAHLLTSSLPTSLVTDPGKTVTADIRINNTGSQPEDVQVGLMKFVAYGLTGQPRLLDRAPGDSYFDWVSMSPNRFTLAANEWKTVHVTIAIPTTAAFGYYYAVTFNKVGAVKSTDPTLQTSYAGGIASLILLEVRSPLTVRQAEVTAFVTGKRVYEYLPTDFTVTMQNTGNIHVAPSGNIFISQGANDNLASIDVNKSLGNLLPQSSRSFDASWGDGFPVYQDQIEGGNAVLDSKGKTVQHLHWDIGQASKFRIGRFTAHLVMTYDNGSRDVPVEASTTFWVIPWKLLLIALAAILVIGAGLYSTMKSLFRRLRRR